MKALILVIRQEDGKLAEKATLDSSRFNDLNEFSSSAIQKEKELREKYPFPKHDIASLCGNTEEAIYECFPRYERYRRV